MSRAVRHDAARYDGCECDLSLPAGDRCSAKWARCNGRIRRWDELGLLAKWELERTKRDRGTR